MDFFQTVMGKRFYEGTMPGISKALEDLTRAIEGIKSGPETGDQILRDTIRCHTRHVAAGRSQAHTHPIFLRASKIEAIWRDGDATQVKLSGGQDRYMVEETPEEIFEMIAKIGE